MHGVHARKARSSKVAVFFIVAIFLITMKLSVFADVTKAKESVKLRQTPSTDAVVLKLIPMGYEVSVLNVSKGWTEVQFEDKTGYVKSEYLETIKTAASKQENASKENKTTSAENSESTALKNGCEGDEVKVLQKLLKDKGVYDGPINGKFGPLTEEAVIRFQKSSGLEADGVVGSTTMNKLKEKSAKETGASNVQVYKSGDANDEIKKIQSALKEKGFYNGPTNGKFGPLTEEAVKRFQKANGIEEDGVVGKVTLELLYAAGTGKNTSDKKENNNNKTESDSKTGKAPAANKVELIEWSDAKNIFTIGEPATIYDVRSGVTYRVKSFSNGLHADVEPITKEDTALLKQTYGGTWSWSPRPVWVSIKGRVMAASINGMPHAGGVNSSNGMDGQVCIHFKGSTTHNGNKSFAKEHQDAVIEAWNAANK